MRVTLSHGVIAGVNAQKMCQVFYTIHGDAKPMIARLNIAGDQIEQPLLSTHKGICHHVQPWTATPKWGITLTVGMKSAPFRMCGSAAVDWTVKGLIRVEDMHVHVCLILCRHGCVSMCCLCELLHVSSWPHSWTVWPCPCKGFAGHVLPFHSWHDERALGGLFMCHVYSRVSVS